MGFAQRGEGPATVPLRDVARAGQPDGGRLRIMLLAAQPELSPTARRRRRRRKMPRGLGLLLVLLVYSCMSGGSHDVATAVPSEPLELGANERSAEQRRSLTYMFYRDNAAPPKPTEREMRRLERNLAAAPQVEVDELRGLYGEDDELLAYAGRDTDRDGVLDYRISHYCGKFFEGDIDLDGDGIRNVYDAAPYNRRVGGVDRNGDGAPDKGFADQDGDGIPDHIDWSNIASDRLGEKQAEQQAALFREFNVILIERSSSFSPMLVQAVDDTLRLLFREPMPTLRTVAVEHQLLISPDLGDNGLMVAQTQTLTVYTKSIKGADPLVVFGLFVHEVDHAWQLAQDFNTGDLRAENKRIHYPPGKFTKSLTSFGWEAEDDTLGEGYHHRLYWPHFYATSPSYLYRGSAPNEWAAWFQDVEAESGRDFLRNSPAVTWGMVGPYSLTSPWEWHADQLMASVYNRIDRGIGEDRAYRTIASLLRARMLQVVRGQWYRYDYRNAAGTTIDRELARQFELTPVEIETLIERYVMPLADLPMLSKALGLDSESLGVDEVIGDGWTNVRERVAGAADLPMIVHFGMRPWRNGDLGVEGEDEGMAAETGEEPPTEVVELPLEPIAEPVLEPVPEPTRAGRVGGVAESEDPTVVPEEVPESQAEIEVAPEPEPAPIEPPDGEAHITEPVRRLIGLQ